MIISMNSFRDVICKNFNRLVDESGMKHKDLADQLGVTTSTFAKWRSGAHLPEVEKVEALAGLFRVDPSEFYMGAENVVPMYGNSSLKKAMIIPDEVIEGFFEIAGDDKIWEMVKGAILIRKKSIQDEKKKQVKA